MTALTRSPICTVVQERQQLTVSLVDERGAEPCLTRRIDHVSTDRLQALAGQHREAFARGSREPRPYDLWATATEELLAAVHDLISCHLVELLAPLPRVAIELVGDDLRQLPVETAHRPGGPALFEITQVFRTGEPLPDGETRPRLWPARRHFKLELWPDRAPDLDAVSLEQSLVGWAHRVRSADKPGVDRHSVEGVERLVHIAGHDPSIPSAAFTPDEAAHVVLSGCTSLPRTLPAGVASAVGSLWPVDDHANATIMAAYHARLASGLGPVEALRQAQVLHRSLPPTAWASYVHVGCPS